MIEKMTSDDLMNLIKSCMDEFWWGPLESAGPSRGFEILEAACDLLEEVSEQVHLLSREVFACNASGRNNATAILTFSRSVTTGSLTVPGSLIVKTPWGLSYITRNFLFWGIGDGASKTVLCTAVKFGADYNVSPASITVLPVSSSIDWTAESVTVTNALSASGGSDMALDMLCYNKNIVRNENETDQSLFLRFRNHEDRISVAAIKRVIEKYSAIGLLSAPMEYTPGYDSGLFMDGDYYLDAGIETTDPHYGKFEHMLLSKNDSRRSFFVVVPEMTVPVPSYYAGIILDQGPEDKHSCMDLSPSVSGFLDVENQAKEAIISALHNELEDKKAAGIRHALIAETRVMR